MELIMVQQNISDQKNALILESSVFTLEFLLRDFNTALFLVSLR